MNELEEVEERVKKQVQVMGGKVRERNETEAKLKAVQREWADRRREGKGEIEVARLQARI